MIEPEYITEVTSRRTVAENVVELELALADGATVSWSPGAHVDLFLAGDVVRQYSLCGDPRENRVLRVAVLREAEGRGGSVWIHDEVRVGDALTIRGPRNHFPLVAAERYLFIAGGIGITPLLPMIRSAHRRGVPWSLQYGGRSRGSMAYLDELPEGDVSLCPEDEMGMLDIAGIVGAVKDSTQIYCCGPEGLLQAVEGRCALRPAGMLRMERFTPRQPAGGPNTAFTVVCALSEVVVDVPAEQSILHALREANIEVSSSCQEGTCGACETVVIDGVVDHRDSVLTPEEQARNDVMMVCCSRSRTPLLTLQV